jgi:hypothetical protein
MAARAFHDSYTWNPDRLAAIHQVTDEAKVVLEGNESAREVQLTATWIETGTHHLGGTKRWCQDAANAAKASLEKSGWSVRIPRVNKDGLTVEAAIAVEKLAETISAAATAVVKVNEALIRK